MNKTSWKKEKMIAEFSHIQTFVQSLAQQRTVTSTGVQLCTKGSLALVTLRKESFENIVGKEENTCKQHIYAPASKDRGHIVLLVSICLSKLNISLLLLN